MATLTILDNPDLFKPNAGAQQRFMDDYTHRYCALAGGWFAGKTWAGARKLLDLHLHNALDANDQPTAVKSAVIAPTYQLANDFDIPELRRAMREMNLAFEFVSDPKRYCFVLPDLGTKQEPSEILIRTADSPDRITGWSVGAIWGDEAARWKSDPLDPQNDPFIQADARLRDPRAKFLQFMVTFTHEGDGTRVYQDFEREPKPDHVLYRAGTIENPHAAAFAEVQRQQLTEELSRQYLQGIAVGTAGQRMYASFDEARNLDDSLTLETDHPLQLAIDFNIDPGMHAILGQHFPDRDLLTAVWTIHEPRMSVKRMADSLCELLRRELPDRNCDKPLQIFGDASGGSAWVGGGESCYDVLRECLRFNRIPHQMRVPRCNPAVGDRVNAVNCALCDAAGNVRYRIHPRCRRLIDDLRLMRWSKDGSADKRDRARSHASDADGYRIYYLLPIRRGQTIGGEVAVM
jgi:hypothetical protein